MRLVTDRDTGKLKGYGYIEFSSESALDGAISKGNFSMDGRDLTVDKAGNKPTFGEYLIFSYTWISLTLSHPELFRKTPVD